MDHQHGRRRRRPASEIDGQPLARRFRRRSLDNPCNLCRLMFSREGLQHLNSLNGLRHHTRASCAASQDEGCKICKFIFLAVCKDHEQDWDDDDHLLFRNISHERSSNIPGIYGLQCTIDGGFTSCIITIHTFAREGRCSLSHQ